MSQPKTSTSFRAPVWILALLGFVGVFSLYSAYSQWTTSASSVLAGTRTFSQSVLVWYALATRSKPALIAALIVRAATELGDLITLSLVFKNTPVPFIAFVAVLLVIELIGIVILYRQTETPATA